ncbi:MAG: DUF3313 domain-containing protein [Pseudomonadota bacterium]
MIKKGLKFAGMLAGLLAMTACAKTEKISDVQPSGFLDPAIYDKLEPGTGALEAAQFYRAPGLDISGYDKILLDPIVAFAPPGDEGDIDPQDKQALLNNFYTLLAQQLEQDYTMVTGPEPGALRLQMAMTKATKKNVTMDTVSTLTPIGLAARNLTEYATGEPTFTGRLRIELELTDSMTEEVLVAAIDERAGGSQISEDQLSSWSSVNAAMEFYSIGIRYRLCQLRGGSNCVKPQTF